MEAFPKASLVNNDEPGSLWVVLNKQCVIEDHHLNFESSSFWLKSEIIEHLVQESADWKSITLSKLIWHSHAQLHNWFWICGGIEELHPFENWLISTVSCSTPHPTRRSIPSTYSTTVQISIHRLVFKTICLTHMIINYDAVRRFQLYKQKVVYINSMIHVNLSVNFICHLKKCGEARRCDSITPETDRGNC